MLRDQFSETVRALLAEDDWLVAETAYPPEDALASEAIFALSNGHMGNRASHEEGTAQKTLPAHYVHGVFDRSEAFMRELCNCPDWTKLRLTYEGQPIGPETGELSGYVRVLDMRHGLLAKRYVLTQGERQTKVEVVKCLSRAHPRCGMTRFYVTPLNYGGVLECENIIDATVTNFIDMPRFRVKHLKTVAVDALNGTGCYVESQTRDFGLSIGTGTRIQAHSPIRNQAFRPYGEVACAFFDALLAAGETLVVDKFAAIVTGRETDDVRTLVQTELEGLVDRGFLAECAQHAALMEGLWARADCVIEGDAKLSHAVRFNLFHLMNTPDPNDASVNVGAKLLSGEEYGGHAFWDTELFVLPFFNYVFPEIARNLVEYRYLLLDAARANAKKNGYQGAQYPWESADTGEEECPSWTIEYDGSVSRCHVAEYEHHVTAAVSMGLYNYVNITDDQGFLTAMGLEILLETARFWSSRMVWNHAQARYEILEVTGPDEWHEPVNNSAYTNHLARWNIETARHALSVLREKDSHAADALCKKLHLTEAELTEWQTRAGALFLQANSGLIEQFDGYFDIPDAVITEWDEKGMPKMPALCIGKRGFERPILKQADVVMLLYLLPHRFDAETQRINFDYYEQRTLHRSSLSPSIHCLMGLRVEDPKRAYAYLERSCYVDLYNNQRNTREGIHAASAGGTWQCVTLGYCGMGVDEDGTLSFHPRLPERWQRVTYHMTWRGQALTVTVDHGGVEVVSHGEMVSYRVDGHPHRALAARPAL